MSNDQKNEPKVTKSVFIIETDMDDDMLISAIDTVEKTYESPISNQEIADKIKAHFESKYYPHWICIVGNSYGCSIKAEEKHYLCFQMDQKTIILFKYR